MTVRTIRTTYSTYEIDDDGKRIRRMAGVNPATERQGQDGQWRVFYLIEPYLGGLLIHWDDAGHCTHTSAIVSAN